MHRRGWRRFLPRRRTVDHEISTASSEQTLDKLLQSSDIRTVEQLDSAIDQQRTRTLANPISDNWLALLILQTPRASIAQQIMDQHPHGYRNKQERLFELIDFNDAYVSTVLSLTPEQVVGFDQRAHEMMARFCTHLKTPLFSDGQFEAITRGLSKEIAVYRAAILAGYKAEMTNRVQDAFGIDMIISNESGQSINVDCKTTSAYTRRLEEYLEDGRLSETDAFGADKNGYCQVYYEQDDQKTLITLLRVGPEHGAVKDFAFVNPDKMIAVIRSIIDTE
jgi:hypothetical protein